MARITNLRLAMHFKTDAEEEFVIRTQDVLAAVEESLSFQEAAQYLAENLPQVFSDFENWQRDMFFVQLGRRFQKRLYPDE